MNGITSTRAYFDLLSRKLGDISVSGIDKVVRELLRAYLENRTVFVFGNGGSAATASHFACDLGKGTAKWLNGRRRFRVVALTDNVALITAWANDNGYENVFLEQLRNLLVPGDVVLAISGSGNSENVISALDWAAQAGARTLGLSGFEGGRMKSRCDTCIVVPSQDMEIIEDVHSAICHALATVLREALAEMDTPEEVARWREAVGCCSVSENIGDERAETRFRVLDLPASLGGSGANDAPSTHETSNGD